MSDRRFAVLTHETMTDEQQRIAAEIVSGPRKAHADLLFAANGMMRGPFNALLRSPVVADPAQKLGEALRFRSSLPAALRELAILLTARRWTAQFEWYAHEKFAREAGLDPAIAAAIADRARPDGLDAEQSAVYEFVSELLGTGAVSDAQYVAVHDAFGETGVVELVALVGYYTLISFLLNVERHPLPEGEPLPLKPL